MQAIAVIFLLLISFHSEASFRCESLFQAEINTQQKLHSVSTRLDSTLNVKELAQVVDSLNQRYGNLIISKSLVKFLETVPDDPNSWDGLVHRHQLYKLSQVLKTLRKPGDRDHFDLLNFAEKLVMLDFLSDESVTSNMSMREKFRYRQAQKSLAYHGLAEVFLADKKVSEEMFNKYLGFIKTPFKYIYKKWHKINYGPLLDVDLALSSLVYGLEKNKLLLQPYDLKLNFQQWYDATMLLLNRLAVSAMFVGATGFIVVNIDAIQKLEAYKAASIQKAEAALDPLVKFSNNFAAINKIEERYKAHFLKSVQKFVEENDGLEPTEAQARLIYKAVLLTQRDYFEINVPDAGIDSDQESP